MILVRQVDDGVLLAVKVVPGASRTRGRGELGGRLKVAVTSPPEAGQANKALVAYLAELLGVPKRTVTIDSGHGSPRKTVRITGVSIEQVRGALQVASD